MAVFGFLAKQEMIGNTLKLLLRGLICLYLSSTNSIVRWYVFVSVFLKHGSLSIRQNWGDYMWLCRSCRQIWTITSTLKLVAKLVLRVAKLVSFRALIWLTVMGHGPHNRFVRVNDGFAWHFHYQNQDTYRNLEWITTVHQPNNKEKKQCTIWETSAASRV